MKHSKHPPQRLHRFGLRLLIAHRREEFHTQDANAGLGIIIAKPKVAKLFRPHQVHDSRLRVQFSFELARTG